MCFQYFTACMFIVRSVFLLFFCRLVVNTDMIIATVLTSTSRWHCNTNSPGKEQLTFTNFRFRHLKTQKMYKIQLSKLKE